MRQPGGGGAGASLVSAPLVHCGSPVPPLPSKSTYPSASLSRPSKHAAGARPRTASSTWMRGRVSWLSKSFIGTPVAVRASSKAVTLALGSACRSTAKAPATWGLAIEVPLEPVYVSPTVEEKIARPGASRSSGAPKFEIDATTSYCGSAGLLVADTPIALEMQAGDEIPVEAPSLPAAATEAMPRVRSASMVGG